MSEKDEEFEVRVDGKARLPLARLLSVDNILRIISRQLDYQTGLLETISGKPVLEPPVYPPGEAPAVPEVKVENIQNAVNYYFPRTTDWDLIPGEKNNETIPVGKSVTMVDSEEMGMFINAKAIFNSPNVKCNLELRSPATVIQLSDVLETLYTNGIVVPMPLGWWVTIYNPVSTLYGMAFNCTPWIPYHRKVIIKATNMGTASITMTTFTSSRVVVHK